jgi:lysophospholipase L1-like esterase
MEGGQAMIFSAQQRIVFMGDSITDCGRQADAAPFGRGYVSMVRNLLSARYPELQLTVINRGISGNTVRDLAGRWERDVIGERPDWLSVKIGINDVWRSFQSGRGGDAVPLAEYEATLHRLLARTQQATRARLILMQPYLIEPRRGDPMRREMDRYGAAVSSLVVEFSAILVPTQEAWDAALVHTQSSDWAEDRIHPTAPGHAVIALAFLRAAGFQM